MQDEQLQAKLSTRFISPDRCRLRKIDAHDALLLLDWHNSDRYQEAAFNSRRVPRNKLEEWFTELTCDRKAIHLLLEVDDVPVGYVHFSRMEKVHGTVYWGLFLCNKVFPRIAGAVLAYFALEYAFEALKMRKVCAEILSSNEKSIHFHQRIGFVREGTLSSHVVKNGETYDVLLFALFNVEWISKGKLISRSLLFSCET